MTRILGWIIGVGFPLMLIAASAKAWAYAGPPPWDLGLIIVAIIAALIIVGHLLRRVPGDTQKP